MHADVIAGRQINQTQNKLFNMFMKTFINPLCNSSLAKSVMANSCGEGEVAALLAEGMSSCAEGELAIDETASTVSISQKLVLYPECLRLCKNARSTFVDHLSGEESVARHFVLEGEAYDNDSLVDIMSGITAVGDAESEGWTFADALARASLSVDTLAEGVVDTSRLPACESSFFIPH